MNMNQPASRKPLRVWPGVVVAVLLVVVRLMPIVVDEVMPIAMMGAVVGGAADSPVVAVPQPRALVRTSGRHRADDRRAVRDVATRPRVDYRRRDGVPVLRLGDPDARRRSGGCGRSEPSPLQQNPAARRSLRRSCSRAECGRSYEPKVSPATSSVRISAGAGPRVPSNSSSLRPQTFRRRRHRPR